MQGQECRDEGGQVAVRADDQRDRLELAGIDRVMACSPVVDTNVELVVDSADKAPTPAGEAGNQ
jgi:hypothetical protein